MNSKEFLDSFIGKKIKVTFKNEEGELFFGILVWNDLDSIGMKFVPSEGSHVKERTVLYYKDSIKSIESAEKKK
jgi:hypothetical protein